MGVKQQSLTQYDQGRMQSVCTSIDGCRFKIIEKDIEKVFYFIFSGAVFTIYQMIPYNNRSRKTNSSQNKNVYLHYNTVLKKGFKYAKLY